MEDDRGSDFYFVAGIIVFFVVWIASAIAGGPLGFIFGWIPALILASIWPLAVAFGFGAVAFVVVLLAILIAIVLVAVGYWQ